MPWSIRYNADKNLLLITTTGVVGDHETKEALRPIFGHPNYSPTVRVFHDFSGATEFKLSADFIHEVGRQIGAQGISARRAYLVTSAIGMGTGRFFLDRMESECVQVFYSREQALAWLNHDVAPSMCLTLSDLLPAEA